MMNWARIGLAFSCLAALLTTAIDYVIRHVEHSSRAASEALSDLRLAYERLALRARAAGRRQGRRAPVHRRRAARRPGTAHDGHQAATSDGRARARTRWGWSIKPSTGSASYRASCGPALAGRGRPHPRVAGARLYRSRRWPASPSSWKCGTTSLPRLPPALEIACFRIVQESLTNALRHASAAQINVRVARTAGAVALTISDDGSGFDTATLAALRAGHLGIVAMQERVRARGGTFTITSTPGAGTRVQVDLPIIS